MDILVVNESEAGMLTGLVLPTPIVTVLPSGSRNESGIALIDVIFT